VEGTTHGFQYVLPMPAVSLLSSSEISGEPGEGRWTVSDELKPCQWCGSAARIVQMAHMERDEQVDALARAIGLPLTAYRGAPANVECTNLDCQASGPFLASAEQAITAWNTRPTDARLAEAERLLRKLRIECGMARISYTLSRQDMDEIDAFLEGGK
jgi:hypothetical protein